MSLRNRSGFSLWEIAIVSFILGIVLAIVFGILNTSQRAVDTGSKTSEAETRARVAVDAIKEELFYAKLDYTDASILMRGKYLRYQVANKEGAFAYGYTDSAGTFQGGWYAIVQFIPDRYYSEPNATGAPNPNTTYTTGINRNASLTEVFAIGKITRRVYNGAGALQREITLVDDVVLNNASQFSSDVDGDGTIDPLFELQDANGNACALLPAQVKMVKINLHVGLWDLDHKRFFLRNNIQQVKFKNTQS